MPPEELLFALLKRSEVVIGKCGFMQACECLMAGARFFGWACAGSLQIDQLPQRARASLRSADRHTADANTITEFRQLLDIPRINPCGLHCGTEDGLQQLADFLEAPRGKPRRRHLGLRHLAVKRALQTLHPGQSITVVRIRATRISGSFLHHDDLLVVSYCVDGELRFQPLRSLAGSHGVEADVLYRGWLGRLIISA